MDAVLPQHVAVVGAGIVGISCALFLQRDGHRVTLVDPNEPGSGCSFGNAGLISLSSVMPSATPGLLWRVPWMLFDRGSPLVLRWRHVPRLAPWLADFLRNSARARVERNCRAAGNLAAQALQAYDTLMQEVDCGDLIRPVGSLVAFETDAAFAASAFERSMMSACGVRYEILDADGLRRLEPNLAPIFRHAIFAPDARQIRNPGRLVQVLAEAFRCRGGTILRDRVDDVGTGADGRPVLKTAAGALAADRVVLAMGVHSGRLARRLGARVTLDAERGYHVMLPTPARPVGRYVRFAERNFSLSPHEGGLRMTSIVELASPDASPDYRRIRRLLPHAAQVLPGLVAQETSIWMGARPSTPDNVPVIGRAPCHPHVYFAFGHSHLGMTFGPVTGRILADLLAGRDPGIDMSPYAPVRPR